MAMKGFGQVLRERHQESISTFEEWDQGNQAAILGVTLPLRNDYGILGMCGYMIRIRVYADYFREVAV